MFASKLYVTGVHEAHMSEGQSSDRRAGREGGGGGDQRVDVWAHARCLRACPSLQGLENTGINPVPVALPPLPYTSVHGVKMREGQVSRQGQAVVV